jgi:hypothetical protein
MGCEIYKHLEAPAAMESLAPPGLVNLVPGAALINRPEDVHPPQVKLVIDLQSRVGLRDDSSEEMLHNAQ